MDKSTVKGMLISLAITIVGLFVLFPGDNKLKVQPTRNELIERQFSKWDGSHIKLEKKIKRGMHDPDSYEHIETRYIDKGSQLILTTSFRGANTYGAIVLNTVTAKVGLNGDILDVITE